MPQDKVPIPFKDRGWREVGRMLADAMQGSDLEVYYSLLCETVRRCEEDMNRLKPPEPIEEATPVKKVAGYITQGSGV